VWIGFLWVSTGTGCRWPRVNTALNLHDQPIAVAMQKQKRLTDRRDVTRSVRPHTASVQAAAVRLSEEQASETSL
jgi:hypothetical protein